VHKLLVAVAAAGLMVVGARMPERIHGKDLSSCGSESGCGPVQNIPTTHQDWCKAREDYDNCSFWQHDYMYRRSVAAQQCPVPPPPPGGVELCYVCDENWDYHSCCSLERTEPDCPPYVHPPVDPPLPPE